MKYYLNKIWGLCVSILLFLCISIESQATHMVGGEIQYKCLGGNKYEFTFILYQNCLPGTASAIDADAPLEYAIYEGTTLYDYSNIPAFITDTITEVISSDCRTNVPPRCLLKSRFTRILELPPSEVGYTVVYQRCCRNPNIVNLVNSGNQGVTYFATLPPNMASECINNTPQFKNEPPQVICVNFPFMYDYSAVDADGDSLVYRLGPSYRGASTDLAIPQGPQITAPPHPIANYSVGFTYLNPINGLPPAQIDAQTGLLTFTPLTAGRYQLTVVVDEYRDGVYLNSHFRDLQILVAACEKQTFANIPVKSNIENTYDVVCDGFTVNFENTSEGIVETFHWDFGDGSPISTEREPSHTYSDTGIYAVKLVVNKYGQCPDSIVRNVRIFPYLTGEYTYSGKQCTGEEIIFSDTVYNSHIDLPFTVEYVFDDTDTILMRNPTYVFNEGGYHIVRMIIRNEKGCATTISKQVYIEEINPFAGNDTFVVKDYNFHLQASGGQFYEWFPKDYLVDPYSARTYVNFPDTGSYTFYVKINSEYGCVGYDTIHVTVVKEPSILLPNAFSPNNDGLNDKIYPSLVGYTKVNYFRIYDRWGTLMFVSYKNGDGWDGTYNGKPCQLGVYYYELSVMDIYNKEHIIKGDITLLR